MSNFMYIYAHVLNKRLRNDMAGFHLLARLIPNLNVEVNWINPNVYRLRDKQTDTDFIFGILTQITKLFQLISKSCGLYCDLFTEKSLFQMLPQEATIVLQMHLVSNDEVT